MPSDEVVNRIHGEKKFIEAVYKTKSKYERKKVLNSASDNQMNILLEILHLILKKEIPIKEKLVNKIKKSHRLPKLVRNLKDEKDFQRMQSKSRSIKISFLNDISCYPELLYNCFNEED